MTPRIQVVDAEVRYGGNGTSTAALGDVSFDVAPGEFVCIVGPSGCGKTTLLNSIDGLTPLTRGRILVDGEAVSGPGRDRAMVFQAPSLFPWRTVLGNVMYGLELQGVPRAEARQRARAIVTIVGLTGFEGHRPAQLSGGMQQRVNLARALVVDPKVVLLDEPYASLDAQTRERMQAELLRVWARTQKTAVFVTHQISEAIFLADRVIVLSSRPARVREIVTVPFSRPRPASLKRTPDFVALEDHIWRLIDDVDGPTTVLDQ